MSDLSKIRERLSWKHFFQGQFEHLLLVSVLVPGALYLVEPQLSGESLGPLTDYGWAYLLVGLVVGHQVLVWLVWRIQLCFGSLSRLLGTADLVIWAAIFFPFVAARVILLVVVGQSDAGSLGWPRSFEIGLGVLLCAPALYTFWSVIRHFGLLRALGADHFRASYLDRPLVREGIFRYSTNAMYTYGFAGLWAVGLFLSSRAALALALFQHAYIWVHMYCTEQPDLDILYRDQ